jgi:hypothetical protein
VCHPNEFGPKSIIQQQRNSFSRERRSCQTLDSKIWKEKRILEEERKKFVTFGEKK